MVVVLNLQPNLLMRKSTYGCALFATGNLAALRAPEFDLKNAVAYGGKLGY